MKLYKTPKAHTKGDKWYFYYRYFHEGTWRLVVKKCGVNRIENPVKKLAYLNSMIKNELFQLESGYNPFTLRKESSRAVLDVLAIELELWMPNKRQSSIGKLKAHFREFSAYVESNGLQYTEVSEFDTAMAKGFLDHVASKGNSGKTLNDKKSMLGILFNSLVNKGKLLKNPFSGVKKFRQHSGSVNTAFSPEERERLLAYLKTEKPWLHDFCLIMFYTFIRPQELFGLQVNHVSLKNRTISVPSSISKNRKGESVVIPKNLLPVLENMDLKNGSDYLFSSNGGVGSVSVGKRNKAYNHHVRALKAVKIEGKTLYSWKHSGVCAAYHATNGDIYSIMRQARHANVVQTATYLKSLGLIRNDAMSGEW